MNEFIEDINSRLVDIMNELSQCSNSREKSLTITKLEEAQMWLNKLKK